MRRIAAPIGLAFLALLGLAAPAWAGSVSGDAAGIDFTANPGEVNNLTLSVINIGGGTITFRIADTVALTDASPSCAGTTAQLDCTMADTAGFSAILGDQNDFLNTGAFATTTTAPIVVSGGLGHDTIQGTDLADTISGDDGNDVIDARGGGGDAVAGGAGDDLLLETIPGADDSYGGGAGIDQVSYASRDASFDMSLSLDGVANDGDPDTFGGLPENDSLGSDIEQLVGGDGDDTITGNAAANVLSGRGGNDIVQGGDGDDSLDGGAGVDTFDGGTGNDVLLGRDSTIDMAFTCGDGSDTAELDDADPAPGADCETVNRTTPPPPPPPPPGPPAPPPAPPPPPPPPAELPPPELNESVNLAPVTGTVTVRLPGTTRAVALSKPISVPVGTVVDTKRGSVTLISAADRTGKTQSGTFRGGAFKITQNPGGAGLVEVRMNGGSFRGCPRVPRGGAGVSARPRRKLFADVRGRYRSVGRYSSATVRGTRWLIEDGCDFTRVKVTQGSVAVRDFVKRTTITVRRGQTYIARPRPRR